ncbi:tetratricopeptide repeat protein [Desnuesiella massiliensis]|uniref:tetratricopeptide repeat protein n=1 Tax=Desnuesiella massiliensis TaxID=1650662 RepID=UPI0006E30934|nr:tetratricopeptide repeat protein [Desnuesiella massiliensis]
MGLKFKQENDTENLSGSSEMEEDILHENDEPINDTFWGCKGCGSLCVEEGYKLKLCKECRDNLSKRPIPIHIKVISLILIAIIIFSLSKFPRSISIGVEYERGVQAEEASKYLTAMKHYENVAKEYPQSDKALVRLYVSYYYCGRIDEAYEVYDKIAGDSPSTKKMDKGLVQEVNEITSKLDRYYSPSKEVYDKLKDQKNAKIEDIINILKPIVDKNPNEVYAAYYLANLYFDMKDYTKASQVLSRVISKYPDFNAASLFQAATYRELGKYDEAVEYCNDALNNNVEDIGAYITLSKIELKRRNNAKGLEYAKVAYEMDKEDPIVVANLALAYHFNNLLSERDKYYKIYQDSGINDKYTDNFLKSIFDGSLQWQK